MGTLVVTGGIGSGKSLVCSFLSKKGIPVYDSDSRTKSLYDTDDDLKNSVVRLFGNSVLDESGRIDRKKLASVVFNDSKELENLESIVHPAVLQDFIKWKNENVSLFGFVVMESAIILEKPLFRSVADHILLVDASLETRIARAMARDGVVRETVLSRISMQKLLNEISEGKVIPDVDYIIMNEGTPEELEKKTDKFLEMMLSVII